MAIDTIGIVKNEGSLALVVESTEGTYTAPSAGDGTEYVEVLSDGVELNLTRELLERDTLSSTIETEAARVGLSEVTGTIPVELKASATAGDAPQSMDVLLRSLLGGKRQQTSTVTSGASHTSTVINLSDTTGFAVGDTVVVKESGAYEARPISAVTTDTSITLAFALDNGAPSDSVELEQFTTYFSDTENAVSFSAEHNTAQDAIQQQAAGLRAQAMTVENWTVGQLPTASFTVGGTSLDRVDADATELPDFTADGQPPAVLEACLWINGNKVSYTELSLSIENTQSFILDACQQSGKIGSRLTQQVTNLTCNPYTSVDTLTFWNAFEANDDVSVFAYAFNPASTSGEFGEVVAIWLPQARIIETPFGDQDGIINDQLSIRAHRSSGNDSVFLGFS